MNKKYTLNSLLPVVLGIVLLAMVLVRSFAPQIILIELNALDLLAISLVTLVLDSYLAPGVQRCYLCIFGFSALTFALLGFAAYLGVTKAMELGILGSVVFTAAAWIYTSMVDRISTGPAAKAAPVVSALGLYLAAQCLMGMF